MNTKAIRYFFFLLIIFVVSTTLFVHPVFGAKPRVKKTVGKVSTASLSYSTARLSRATRSVVVTFTNLTKAKRVSYTLSYSANGIQQGVVGSLTPTGQSTESRDLYFGTCSKGVCTPHYNITNARLVITTVLSSGGQYVKAYKIKF